MSLTGRPNEGDLAGNVDAVGTAFMTMIRFSGAFRETFAFGRSDACFPSVVCCNVHRSFETGSIGIQAHKYLCPASETQED